MKKTSKILLILVLFCIIGTVNVYAAQPQILLQGDESAKASEIKTLDVKLQADADMRRSTIQYRI